MEGRYEINMQALSLDDATVAPTAPQTDPAVQGGAYRGGSENDSPTASLGPPTMFKSGVPGTLTNSQGVGGGSGGGGRFSFAFVLFFAAKNSISDASVPKGSGYDLENEDPAPFKAISPQYMLEVPGGMDVVDRWDGQEASMSGPRISAIAEVHRPRESGGSTVLSAAQTSPYHRSIPPFSPG